MHLETFVHTFLHWSFIVCFGYLSVLYMLTIFCALIASYENLTRKTDAHAEDYDAILYSRFTIPVSLVVPAYNEEDGIVAVVRRLLDLDYPEYEVIVVNDGSPDGTFNVLESEFALEPLKVYYRQTLRTKPVQLVYRSKTDSRLLVVNKENGGKADALNCGVNFARYRYLCCLDGDTIYKREALLAAMRVAVKDPANILGMTGLIAVCRHLDTDDTNEVGHKTIDHHVWSNLQHLEMLRAFVNNRLAWSRLGFMLCVSGAFGIWRRDVVIEVGGFATHFSCEDMEMTFRVLEKYRRERRPGKIVSLPDLVAITEGPENIPGLISQRERWQRVILETVWYYRRMLLNPRYGLIGLLGVPYIVISECLGPLMQILVVVSLAVAIAFGELIWKDFLAMLGVQVFVISIMSSVALWMNDWSFRYYRLRDLLRLTLIAPLDMFWYRPILVYAGAKGVVGFLSRDKGWQRFARNRRRNGGR